MGLRLEREKRVEGEHREAEAGEGHAEFGSADVVNTTLGNDMMNVGLEEDIADHNV